MMYTITAMEAPKPETRPMLFQDLKYGDVFHTKDNEDIYLRIITLLKEEPNRAYNAVNISNGRVAYFGDNVPIVVYDGMIQFNKVLFKDYVKV